MIRLLIFLFLVGGILSGCKSVKNLENSKSTSFAVADKIESVDSSSVVSQEIAKEIEEEDTKETIEQTFIPLDSAGMIIFKPVTISTKTTKSTRITDSNKNESEVKVETFDFNSQEQATSDTIAVNLEAEGIDPIESIASALFPTWVKLLAAALVLVPVLLGLWLKRKKKTQ